jgi:hypothetical protein
MIRWTTLDGYRLIPGEMERMTTWLAEQGFEPGRIPMDAYFAHDTTTDEWVADYYVEPRRLDPVTEQVPRVRVRRSVVSPAPLPFLAAA